MQHNNVSLSKVEGHLTIIPMMYPPSLLSSLENFIKWFFYFFALVAIISAAQDSKLHVMAHLADWLIFGLFQVKQVNY